MASSLRCRTVLQLIATLLNAESCGIQGRNGFRGSRRQGEREGRAAPAVAQIRPPCDLICAARSDDPLTDCQAHAAVLRVRRQESVEYLVDLVQGQPEPCA
jgi:hypothetical protein